MSEESLRWLNTHILVGFTEKNREPWWFRPKAQASESSIYPGPVPADDVLRRLFSWDAEKWPVVVQQPNGESIPLDGQAAIVHGETGHVFRVGSPKYVIHQYRDWLLENASHILGNSELHIGSAGLLRRGAGAFVTIERPETVVSRSGMALKTRLLAATSHDSKIASTYKMVNTIVVCDNTLDRALYEEGGAKYRVRHTPNSFLRIPEVRETLNLMVESDKGVVEFVDSLADITVTESQWQEIVSRLVDIPTDSLPRVKARLENKRLVMDELWRTDPRCRPWRGSALGAFQVFNTYRHHLSGSSAKKSSSLEERFNRNMASVISDSALNDDHGLLRVINSVVGSSA
jgi:phage/plasmid-like protein (TIGR03299 family)